MRRMLMDNKTNNNLVMNENDMKKMERELTQKYSRDGPNDDDVMNKKKLLIESSDESSEDDDYKNNSKYQDKKQLIDGLC